MKGWGSRGLRQSLFTVAAALLVLGGLAPPAAAAPASGGSARVNSVTAFGSAVSHGPDGSQALVAPLVGIARAGRPGMAGYWVVAADGGVFSYGSAPYFGSLAGARHPVVGIAASPNASGYWLAARDGGVFAFGGAPFLGSLGGKVPGVEVVGIASTPTGAGYWLAARDGGVFAFGDARFLGSQNGGALPAPISAMAASPYGQGYWLVGRDGQVYAFGVSDHGSPADYGVVEGTAVGIAAHTADGYWVAHGELLVTESGESGPEVAAVQRRLDELGYWPGPASGRFDSVTQQAVYAFQKIEGLPTTGKVDPQTRARLSAASRPIPASTEGDLIEVDKTRQVVLVVRQGKTAFVFNASTGTEKPYWYGGKRYMADTPTGRFVVRWEIDGYRESRLGRLYRPKYFNAEGHAVHGSSFVPPYPASHGCIRVSNAAIDFIWGQGLAPVGSQVWVHGTSPRR